MSETTTPSAQSQEPAPEIVIQTIADLAKQLAEPITVELIFGKGVFRATGRRLTPEEERILDLIITVVQPPVTKGKNIDEDRIEYTDAKFLTAKSNSENKARAVAIYWCFPDVNKMKPGLKDYNEIQTFINIESGLNTTALNFLYNGCRNPGITVGSLVNFTSAETSAKS